MLAGDRYRIAEACAEAQASLAVNVALGALWRFAHPPGATWADVLEAISWAAAEGDKVRFGGWDFLQDCAA